MESPRLIDAQFTHGKLLEAASLLRLPVGVLVESLGLAPDVFAPSTPSSRQLSAPGSHHSGAWAYPNNGSSSEGSLAGCELPLLDVSQTVDTDHDAAFAAVAQWAHAFPEMSLNRSMPALRALDDSSSVSGVSHNGPDMRVDGHTTALGHYTPGSSVSHRTTTDGATSHVLPSPVSRQGAQTQPEIRLKREPSQDIWIPDVVSIPSDTPGFAATTDALPRGPCSKVWTLPPRIRRKQKPKPVNSDGSVSKRKRAQQDLARDAPKRRGAYTDETKKRNTALTRILKSCIRCRMNRGRCNPDPGDPYGACLTCKGITGPTLCKMPCYRYIVTDASLYREQVAPYQLYSRRWQTMDIVDIPSSDWASPELRTVVVSPNHLHAPFEFRVRKFIPVEGDLLEEQWMTATGKRSVAIPRYALADMHEAARSMKEYIERNVSNFIAVTVGSLDQLLWETYTTAFRHIGLAKTQEERTLMTNAFRLWVTCRLISNPVHICGEDKLGGQAVYSPDSLHNGKVPMPVIITAQFECINYTSFLRPWSKLVLKQLNELVLAKKREYWLTIYYAMFVLLHSCSMMTRRDEETARQYDTGAQYAHPESIRAHHSGARTMLAHFHFINKGVIPFSLPHTEAGKQELAKAANLDDQEVEFVWRTSRMVNDPARAVRMRFARERGLVGDDLYWISMLYDREWKPDAND